MDSPRLRASASKDASYNGPSKEVQNLLENPETIPELFLKIQRDEFCDLVHTLFDAHSRLNELLLPAINRELAATKSVESFRLSESSFLYNIISTLFSNDLGRKYLQLSITPLCTSCTQYIDSKSQESEDVFVSRTATEFLTSMTTTLNYCPLHLRDVLFSVFDATNAKFPGSGKEAITNLIFSQLLPPALETPWEHFLIDKNQEKFLNITTLRSQECAELLKKVSSQLTSADNFITKLLDKNDIDTLREVIDSNLVKSTKQAELQLGIFLASARLGDTIKSHLRMEDYRSRFFEYIRDTSGWTKMKGSAKFNIELYSKKVEDSKLVVWKMETLFKAEYYNQIVKILADPVYRCRQDRFISIIKRVDKKEEVTSGPRRRDFYLRTNPMFPIAARDYIYAQYDYWGENEGYYVTFSIELDDFPKFPKVVRGEILVGGCKIEKMENGQVKMTEIAHIDSKGNLPAWLLNGWNDNLIRSVKDLHMDVLACK